MDWKRHNGYKIDNEKRQCVENNNIVRSVDNSQKEDKVAKGFDNVDAGECTIEATHYYPFTSLENLIFIAYFFDYQNALLLLMLYIIIFCQVKTNSNKEAQTLDEVITMVIYIV